MKKSQVFLVIISVVLILFYSLVEAQFTAPTNLTAKAISSNRINLTWIDTNNGKDNETGTSIERSLSPTTGFAKIGSVGKNITTYDNIGLTSGMTFYYRVQAIGRNTGVSPYSNIADATTYQADTTPPTISITSPSSGTTYTTAQTVTISASASDNVGVTKVEFYDGSALKGTDTTNSYSYSWSFTASDNGPHSWVAKAYDAANNSSVSNVISLVVNIPTADTTPPSVPTGLTATSVSCSQINLSWNVSTDNVGVAGYKIYRNGLYLKSVTGTSTSDTGLGASTQYCYTVSAYDAAGNESEQNGQVCVTTPACPDTTPPTVLITGPASGTTYTTAQTVTITATASDNVGVTKVEFYDGATLKGTATTNPYTYTWSFTGADNGTHNWTTKAYDAAGNIGSSSTVNLIVNIDVTPPTVSIISPSTGTTYTSAQTVTITASASDNVGVTKVEFYDGSTLMATDTTSPYTYTWSFTSSNNGTHSWTAKSYDAAGNSSTSSVVSLTVNIGTADTAPVAPNNLTATAISSSQINLTWQDNANNETGFHVWRYSSAVGWSQIADVNANTISYLDKGLSPSTTYQYAVRAYNSISVSSWSNIPSATTLPGTGDTTPPTGSITINSGSPFTNSTSVTLTLSASDSSGVSQMCISDTTSCTSTSWETYATSKTWTLPTGDGSKTIYVWYKDSAGNANTTPYSDSITLDTTAPAIPSGLTATAFSSSQINLSWNPSFDTGGSGLAGYKVYPILVTTPIDTTATNYSDYNLTESAQYCYTVAAYDGAGNLSAQSGQACAVTQGGSAAGAYLFSEHFGGTISSDSARATAVAVDGSGNIVIAGYFYGSVDFGGGILSSAAGGNSDIFVAKYTAAGTHLWSRHFGGTSNDVANGVAVDGSGNIVVTGYFSGTADFGGGPLISGSSSDMFVAKYSAAGSHVWSGQFGGTTMSDAAVATAIAVDGSGNIVVAGYFYGSANFGGGLLSSAGSSDIFVAKYSAAGTHLWARHFGGTSNDVANGVAVDGSGNIVVAGYFYGSANFGGGLLSSAGGSDIFVAKYTAAGAYSWSDSFGGTANDAAYSVTVDGSRNIIITGYFNGAADFGDGPLVSTGGADIVLAKYSEAGAHIWSKQFGSDYSYGEVANSAAADSSGNIILTGSIIGPVDFGSGWLFGKGNYDIFIAKFSAAGGYLWSKRFVGSYTGYGKSAALDSGNNIIVTGTFEESVDFGGGLLTSPGGTDTFLVKYAP